LAALLQQNFENFPHRVRVARSIQRPAAVYSTDTDEAATTEFNGDDVVVYNGLVGRPSVTVRATVDQIVDVSQLHMKAGGLLPSASSPTWLDETSARWSWRSTSTHSSLWSLKNAPTRKGVSTVWLCPAVTAATATTTCR